MLYFNKHDKICTIICTLDEVWIIKDSYLQVCRLLIHSELTHVGLNKSSVITIAKELLRELKEYFLTSFLFS